MYPMIPGDLTAGAVEMACYIVTAAAALISCLAMMRF
jgi:hypothetical protein